MAMRKNSKEINETPDIKEEISIPEGAPKKILDHPKLHEWEPSEEDEFFVQDGASVIAKYERISEIGTHDDTLCTYLILLQHFVARMPDILKHINYFLKFYDTDHEFLIAYLSLKFIIDTRARVMTTKTLRSYIVERIMTDTFMDNIQRMVDDLYTINIDTDKGGNYRSTPKITNEHAKVILAISFTIRCIMPACIHFSNVCPAVFENPEGGQKKKTGYINCFITIFTAVIRMFEKRSIPVYGAIRKFVEYRVNKRSNSDAAMLSKKKQIHGDNLETYLTSLINEVLIVKSIYKIDYDQSVVSYFDGIIMKNYKQFKSEKFKSKPVELSSEDTKDGKDDDFLSHAEALEMSIYRIDETNSILTKANSMKVLERIRRDFNIHIDQDEFDFYNENVKLNEISQKLLHMFYSNLFHDSTAIILIPRDDIIFLLITLKKYLQMKGMVLLPQVCTATVRGKFKENVIKNRRFNEKYDESAMHKHQLKEKFKYVEQINPKESHPKKTLSTIINSTFEWVDYNPEINGKVNDDIDMDTIIYEYEMFEMLI